MSDLEAYLRRVAGFHDLSAADQVRFFAWYLHDVEGRDHFAQADIVRCYTGLGISKPANITSYLSRMAERKPPELIRSREGLRLERRVRDEFATRYGKRAATVHVVELLAALPGQIADSNEREFLEETLRCFQSGAYRAAIVMCWNLAYSHLCEHVFSHRLADFNARIPIVLPKERLQVAKRDDFSELKESQVLTLCRSASITSPSVGTMLTAKLGTRNAAAHPSGVKFTQLSAEAYITELVENVVLKY